MKKFQVIGIVAVILLTLGVVGYFALGKKEYKGYEVVQELEISEVLEYAEVDGALVRCGREGAQAVSKDGTLLWNVTYGTMKNPKFAFCGSVMAAVFAVGRNGFHKDLFHTASDSDDQCGESGRDRSFDEWGRPGLYLHLRQRRKSSCGNGDGSDAGWISFDDCSVTRRKKAGDFLYEGRTGRAGKQCDVL